MTIQIKTMRQASLILLLAILAAMTLTCEHDAAVRYQLSLDACSLSNMPEACELKGVTK